MLQRGCTWILQGCEICAPQKTTQNRPGGWNLTHSRVKPCEIWTTPELRCRASCDFYGQLQGDDGTMGPSRVLRGGFLLKRGMSTQSWKNQNNIQQVDGSFKIFWSVVSLGSFLCMICFVGILQRWRAGPPFSEVEGFNSGIGQVDLDGRIEVRINFIWFHPFKGGFKTL